MKPSKGQDYIYRGEGTASGETFTVISVSKKIEHFKARMNNDSRLVDLPWTILLECELLLPEKF